MNLMIKLHYFIYMNHYRLPYFLYKRDCVRALEFPSVRLLEHCINNSPKKPRYLLNVSATFLNFQILQGKEAAIERCMIAFSGRINTRERLRQLINKFVRENV